MCQPLQSTKCTVQHSNHAMQARITPEGVFNPMHRTGAYATQRPLFLWLVLGPILPSPISTTPSPYRRWQPLVGLLPFSLLPAPKCMELPQTFWLHLTGAPLSLQGSFVGSRLASSLDTLLSLPHSGA